MPKEPCIENNEHTKKLQEDNATDEELMNYFKMLTPVTPVHLNPSNTSASLSPPPRPSYSPTALRPPPMRHSPLGSGSESNPERKSTNFLQI